MESSKEQTQKARNRKELLNEVGLALAKEIVARHDIATIRKTSLSNMDRWNANGVWVSAHEEWRNILIYGSNESVAHAMTSMDQRSVRLRQSAPYTGLIDEETRLRIFAEIMKGNVISVRKCQSLSGLLPDG